MTAIISRNKTEVPCQISGIYTKINAGFNSGIYDLPSFHDTIAHIKEVLTNAVPNGNPYWKNGGVIIQHFIYQSKKVLNSPKKFDSLTDFIDFMKSVDPDYSF